MLHCGCSALGRLAYGHLVVPCIFSTELTLLAEVQDSGASLNAKGDVSRCGLSVTRAVLRTAAPL